MKTTVSRAAKDKGSNAVADSLEVWRPNQGSRSSHQTPRVLLYFPTVTYFRSLLRISRVLRENGIADPVIYAPVHFPGAKELQAQAAESQIPYLCFMKPDLSGYYEFQEHIRKITLRWQPTPRSGKTIVSCQAGTSLKTRLKLMAVRAIDPGQWRKNHQELFRRWIAIHSQGLSFADSIIDSLGIDIVIVPDETIDYNGYFFISSMRAAGKRSLLLQLAVPSTDEVDGALDQQHFVRDNCQKLFGRLFPQWIRTVDGQPLTRVPLGRAVAVEADNLAPHFPWLSFTSGSDVVGVNSCYLRDRLVELGGAYRRDSMILMGSPEDDDIVKAKAGAPVLRRELAQMFGWTKERPILLVNPVGDLRHQYGLPEFESYHELLRFWLKAIRDFSNFHIVISPHPSFRFAVEDRTILEELASNIVWRGATELIPACDLYMSYGGSSTPRLAAAAGVPVLNYLCYDVKITQQDAKSYFDGFDTIVVARNRSQLIDAVQRLNDKEFFSDLRQRAKLATPYFGMQQGSFTDRLAKAISILVGGSGPLTEVELQNLRNRLGEQG